MWNFKSSVNAQHCVCQHAQDQTRKVLIIKTLKSQSPAEVADIFNVSKRQVERICKRYQENGDVHDRSRSGRPRKTTAQDDSLLIWQSKTRPMSTTTQLQEEWTPATPVSSRTVRWILARNGLHGHIAAQKPALNKRQLRNLVAYAKAHSLMEGWTAEKWLFQMNCQLSFIPSAANIVDDPQGSVWTHGSPRRQSNLEVERLWFGVTSNTEVPGRSVRWMVTLIVPNINIFLPPSTFPTTKEVRFFNRMDILAIPQVPLWGFSGGRRSRSFRDGQHSLQIWILFSISGEEWRRKLGGPSRRGALGCLPWLPRRLHQQALWLSAKPDGNCSAGQRNPYKILMT